MCAYYIILADNDVWGRFGSLYYYYYYKIYCNNILDRRRVVHMYNKLIIALGWRALIWNFFFLYLNFF